MGRIKNKILYPDDPLITLDDYVIGSDVDNNGKTQNYPLRSIVDLVKDTLTIEASQAQPRIKLRTSHLPSNVDEPSGKWLSINQDEDTGVEIRKGMLEVTLENFEDFEKPVLLLDRYTPNRKKGYAWFDNKYYQYSRSAYKHEELYNLQQNGRVNEFEITSPNPKIIDILPEKYLIYRNINNQGIGYLKRKGGNRECLHKRQINQQYKSNYMVDIYNKFALRLRYIKNGKTVETEILKTFSVVARTNQIKYRPRNKGSQWEAFYVLNISYEIF